MKKLLLFPMMLVAALFVCFSCMDDDKPLVVLVWDEPAITDSLENVPVIRTAYGIYYAPALSDTLPVGSHLWVSFILDEGVEKVGSFFTAGSLKYLEIGHSASEVISGMPPGDEDGYTDSIRGARLYTSYIGNYLYFGFEHKSPADQQYEYRIYCSDEPANSNNIPTFYIKAKSLKENPAGESKDRLINYGFDMTRYIDSDLKTSPVRQFYVKYKTGTKDGKDVYDSFKTSPVQW